MWVMWLATGSYAADVFGDASCDARFLPDWWSTGCHETQAIIAFSFLNWIARKLHSYGSNTVNVC